MCPFNVEVSKYSYILSWCNFFPELTFKKFEWIRTEGEQKQVKKSQTPGLALNPRAVESSSAQLHLVVAVASPNSIHCPESVLSGQVAINSGHVMQFSK